MLPQDSAEVESKKMEWCFFTNQCWDEIRRVSNDDGGLLFEHFKDMAMLHCSQIQQVRLLGFKICLQNSATWEEFLTFFVEACNRQR